jgi:cytochrome b561
MLGWAHSGARPQGDYGSFFGLFHVPQFTSPDKATADAFEDRHIYAAYVLLALIVIHFAAAAWHQFIKRDRVAARMADGEAG